DHNTADAGQLAFLPALNAGCNAVTTLLILYGLVVIHHGEEEKHRQAMLGAFTSSTLFLIGYITYHYVQGETHFMGQGWIRPAYFSMLISHIILSAFALPLVLSTFYLALSGRYDLHTKFAKVTYPIWLYVSITGVLIFFVLKHY